MAGLLWWRHRRALSSSRAVRGLRERFRSQALEVDLCEAEVRRLARAFRREGIDFVLGKGLAASRLYAAPGMRPLGDIDLYVEPEAAARAIEVSRRVQGSRPRVAAFIGRFAFDVHAGVAELGGLPFSDVLARGRPDPRCGVSFLSPEDHLRLLSLHALRHGMARPLWLCDVAAAAEALPSHFDRNRLFGSDAETARRVRAALEAARALLDAELPPLPGEKLPRWFLPTILRQWNVPFRPRVPMEYALRHPRRLSRELRSRWPNGIEATEGTEAPFDDGPRVMYQLGECARRIIRFANGS